MGMGNKRVRGFSLIELMVSMLIGLIILNGVIQVVVNSKRSFLDNQEVSQIQENARFAIETLSRELRAAGYFGCAPSATESFNVSALTATDDFLLSSAGAGSTPKLLGITGYLGADVAPASFEGDRKKDTDAIIVRRTDSFNEGVIAKGAVESSGSLSIGVGGSEIKAGQALALISPDCSKGLAFEAGAVTGTPGALTIAGVPLQGNGVLLGDFKAGSTVTELVTNAYYIGNSTVVSGTPALMREVLWVDGSGKLKTRSEELALGIADMQLKYGTLSSNGDLQYIPDTGIAALDWNDVVVVQVKLLMQSLKPVHNEAQTIQFREKDLSSRYLHQVASATIRVRNQ